MEIAAMNINSICQDLVNNNSLDKNKIITLLKTTGKDLETLFTEADKTRSRYMGEEIFLRGIIEFSNYCKKNCHYCGIGNNNKEVHRYRISTKEILETCKEMMNRGQTTVVLQSGEDAYYTDKRFGELLYQIKKENNIAITVSVGVRNRETYQYWKDQGMDRYLLRFETSNEDIFKNCHPDDTLSARIECIEILRNIGVQTGSGFLIGLPDETYENLADDIIYCTRLNLDMIGIGPFIPHEKTALKNTKNPFDNDTFFKVIAILRLLNKDAHIPSTTAFDAIDPKGRNLLLKRGANVFMPNATPKKYRKDYQLYPGKPCVDESANDCAGCVKLRVLGLGRKIGTGPGHSIRKQRKF